MKRALICTALLACLAYPAQAANIMWQGDLFITAVNTAAACNAVNMKVGDFARFNFRPRNVGTNGNSDLLSWTLPRAAGQLQPNGGSLDAATQATVRTIFGSAGFSQHTNSAIAATVDPPIVGAGDNTVSLSIVINNFFSSPAPTPVSGCNVTFQGALSKRPN